MNFIKDFDVAFQKEKKDIQEKFGAKSISRYNFYVYANSKVRNDCGVEYSFLIKKGEKTQFLIHNEGVRIYLSDLDILELLIDNSEKIGDQTLKKIISFLKDKIKDKNFGKQFELIVDEFDQKKDVFSQKRYLLNGIPSMGTEIFLNNKHDIQGFCLDNLLFLMNLILSKDIFSQELGDDKTPEFLKRTAYKYIIILQSVVFKDQRLRHALQEKVYNSDNNEFDWREILDNRNKLGKRFFNNIKEIEKMKIL